MRIQRLFDMSPAELAFRGRQEVFKAVERLSVAQARVDVACRFDRAATGASMKKLLERSGKHGSSVISSEVQEHLQEKMSQRFYAGVQHDWSAAEQLALLETDPAFDMQQLIARADSVCRESFEILGYGELSFGRPVDWHLDPVSGQRSPVVHWSQIDALAPEQVGDSKVVWELNRHQWLLDLGQAYALTGDDKYARCCVALVTEWMEHNPFARGINWSSALEVAMRLISWCWALAFFKDSAALTPKWFQTLLGSLQRHAGFVERNLSRYFSPNTHLTVEALALYYAGTILPELQGARHWRALGRSVLLEQLPVQVPEGGVYFEQSTRYQYYTVEIYLHFAILAARNDDTLPGLVNERLREMLHVLLQLRRPDGTVPQMGDTDGGWLCPLVRRKVGDYRALFSTAAVFLNDPQLAWAAKTITAETLYMLGPRAATEWTALGLESPSADHGVRLPGACVVMRSGWERDAHQLIFDTGPLGCHVSGGHGHADLLAIQCSAFGENYLVDPGTGSYVPGSASRQHFRSTQAHSTVLVDDKEQAQTTGPFSWQARPAARLLEFNSTPERVFAAAQHDAYAHLADPVTHQRRVWFLDSSFWLIVDDLLGTTRHQVDLCFQFAPLPVTVEADGWIRARGKASSLLLKTFATQDLQTDLVCGGREPLQGWYSPNYGQMIPAPALMLGVCADLPLRLATLIIPMLDPRGPCPLVTPRIQDGQLRGLFCNDAHIKVPDFGDDRRSLRGGGRITS